MNPVLDCIVLIDDNEGDNYVHRRAITEAQCARRVVCFEMAEDALEQIKMGTIAPDLIFLDINMPGMDGWEFLDEYGRLPNTITNRAVVVVMLTTSLNPRDREKAESMTSLADFYNKPLTASICKEIIRKHFSQPSGPGHSRVPC